MHGESGGSGSLGVQGRDAVITGLAMETIKIEMKWGVGSEKNEIRSVGQCANMHWKATRVWMCVGDSELARESPRKNAGWIGE